MPDYSYGMFLIAWPIQQMLVSLVLSANDYISLLLTIMLSYEAAAATHHVIELPSKKLERTILSEMKTKMYEEAE